MKRLIFIAGCFAIHAPLFSQKENNFEISEEIWSDINTRLQMDAPDTSFNFILKKVRTHCHQEPECLFLTYEFIRFRLERQFNLPAAIYVEKEVVKIANAAGDKTKAAKAHMNLSRYYDALGNFRLAAENIEEAKQLFQQLNNATEFTKAEFYQLEKSLSYRDQNEVLAQMDSLLLMAIERNDTVSIHSLHLQMIRHKLNANRLKEAENHIRAVEKRKFSNPLLPKEYGIVITAKLGRADLARARNQTDTAIQYYLQTLRLCEEEPSRWLEIYVLHQLTEMEWSAGNKSKAKDYLNNALIKAGKLVQFDLLEANMTLQSKIAASEKRFEDAFLFEQKKDSFQALFAANSKGFTLRNFYLELEKNRLSAEMAGQALELKWQKSRQRYMILILGLSLLLASSFVYAFFYTRKKRNSLALQHKIIVKQSEKLREIDKAKTRFFTNISHELRTPLTLLKGPLNSLGKDPNLHSQQIELLGLAQQSTKHLEFLISEILELNKLELGKMQLHNKLTNYSSFFKRELAQFESLASLRQIDFKHQLNLSPKVSGWLDQSKCRIILVNLLSNAFKFTPNGGRITVEISLKNEILNLMVSDTGKGISKDDLPYIFDRYFQSAEKKNEHHQSYPADQNNTAGLGIGLSLSREYANLMGGKITVKSIYGNGSTFCLQIPVSIQSPPEFFPENGNLHEADIVFQKENPTNQQKNPTIQPTSKKNTVLIVEDNPELQQYLRIILDKAYHLIFAENGKVALETLEIQKDIALIVSDLMMPVMDGYTLLKTLKAQENTRQIPVIMLTAKADLKDKLHALRIGVDDYLVKPFEEEELLARIKNLLRNLAARERTNNTVLQTSQAEQKLRKEDLEWLESFESFIKQNIDKETLSVPMLAEQFHMSESTLLRQLKRLTGLSPVRYMADIRLTQAWELLQNRSFLSVENVATHVGYQNVRTFSKNFKRRFGKYPSDILVDK